jgi:dihydropteroate synthase
MLSSWRVTDGSIPLRRPLLMGVVNVTPDSFSDGGELPTIEAAVAHGRRLAAEGADIVDVGGESTRPGAEPVGVAQELDRVLPVVRTLVDDGLVVSIDTMKAEVAEAAVTAGASIINDVGGMGDAGMRAVAAGCDAGVVVMHMLGTPRTMQDDPRYRDVVDDISRFLATRCETVVAEGVDPGRLVVDPGIGFGKTVEHNLEIIDRLADFAALGYPVLVGASRKRFLGVITGSERPADRDGASAAVAACAVMRGAMVIRTHDVARTREAVQIAWAIVRGEGAPWAPVVAEGATPG